jgi:hypothetical protein
LSPIYKNKGEKNDSKNYRGFRNNFVIDWFYSDVILLTLLFESSVKIWIVRGLCQIMKVFVPAFKYIVAFI